MNKLLQGTFVGLTAVGVLGAGSLLTDTTAHAQGSATVGGVRGQIRDKATGEGALGATVVATSPALVGEQVVLTDESGLFYISSLPPGVYTLTVYYENKTFSRGNVLIQLGKEAVVNVTVDPTAAGTSNGAGGAGEIIEIQGSTPIVDQGSTKTGITIDDNYTRNIPTGRTFGAVLTAAGGSQSDQYGVSLAGSTSAENTYIVEGINTTDTAFGGLSSNLPTEFIQETEVITGGYNAEFGRATGGIVNVVTKSGSNEFRGSVFGYYRPGALVSDAERIVREGNSIDSENNLDYNWDVGAEIGGPIIKDKLWFHVGFNPSSTKTTFDRIVSSRVDADDDGNPDIDPTTGFTVLEEVSRRGIVQKLDTYFFTAKINGAIGPQHQFQISAFGNPRSGEAVPTSLGIANLIRNPNNSTFDNEDGAYDLAAKWTSKFNDGKTQIDAVAGFHRGFDNVGAVSEIGNQALVIYNYERSLFDFNGAESNIDACNDMGAGDQYDQIVNCPVTGYRSQGLGTLEERTNDRISGVVSLTQRVRAAGYHTFKIGLDGDVASYDSVRGLTGGAAITRLSPGPAGLTTVTTNLRIIPGLDPAMPLQPGQIICAGGSAVCEAIDDLTINSTNTSLAAYVQDSWQIRPNLTFNAGVRWERQVSYVPEQLAGLTSPEGEVIPDQGLVLNNQWAPRLGLIYDPTAEGKAKLFAHWGRFYEYVPMDINVRAFGAEIQDRRYYNGQQLGPSDDGYDPNCAADFVPGQDLAQTLFQCPESGQLQRSGLGGFTTPVSDGLSGQFTEELVLGAEYEIRPDLKLSASYIHRSLPKVIEDISTDGGQHYLITNPGDNFDSQAADLRNQAEAVMAEQPDLAQLYLDRADQLEAVKRFDKPIRTYDALQFTATQRFTKNSLLLANYTYSVSKGNYPGLFSTETGQLDPNLTSLYDLPDLMANRYGNMGLDRPHNLKVDGFYAFDFEKAGILTVGASFRGQSGIPNNALAGHLVYGEDESFLLPRGDAGRSPFTTQVDTHFAYGYQLNKTTRLEGFVRIFNLFNQQEELNADATYTFDFANPIVGGGQEELAHVKALDPGSSTDSAQTVTPYKNFGNLNSRQAPRNIQLGFRLTF